MVGCFLGFLVILYAVIGALMLAGGQWLYMQTGIPGGSDFLNVYAAGIEVHRGIPYMAYDWTSHHEIEQSLTSHDVSFMLSWSYPPPFLAVASLLALMPYDWAFAAYMVVGLILYVGVIYGLAPAHKLALCSIIAFPGTYNNFVSGQNGFITTSLVGAGFIFLEKRPWIAGLMFGLVSYKPHFFILIPLALALGGYGRALLSALTTALVCGLLSWLAYGTLPWEGFLFATKNLLPTVFRIDNARDWYIFQSLFGWARTVGAGIGTCYILQSIAIVTSLLIVVWVWTSKTSLETRAATLCGAIFLTTPYFLNYDLVLIAVPVALLTRQGMAKGFLPYEKKLLIALWFLPAFAPYFSYFKIPIAFLLISSLMALCLMRTKFPHRNT